VHGELDKHCRPWQLCVKLNISTVCARVALLFAPRAYWTFPSRISLKAEKLHRDRCDRERTWHQLSVLGDAGRIEGDTDKGVRPREVLVTFLSPTVQFRLVVLLAFQTNREQRVRKLNLNTRLKAWWLQLKGIGDFYVLGDE
jgi:hypothetical protein